MHRQSTKQHRQPQLQCHPIVASSEPTSQLDTWRHSAFFDVLAQQAYPLYYCHLSAFSAPVYLAAAAFHFFPNLHHHLQNFDFDFARAWENCTATCSLALADSTELHVDL
jgi:hypothetical protein